MRKIIRRVGALALVATATAASGYQSGPDTQLASNPEYAYDGAIVNLAEARRTCVAAGGTFRNTAGRLTCTKPRRVPGGHWRPRPRAR